MTVANFLYKTYKNVERFKNRSRVVCNDGYNVSIQASEYHYCTPRLTQDYYREVELGFPSKEDELINIYAETDFDYTKTVYGYVPIGIVEELIEKHGGINVEETLC